MLNQNSIFLNYKIYIIVKIHVFYFHCQSYIGNHHANYEPLGSCQPIRRQPQHPGAWYDWPEWPLKEQTAYVTAKWMRFITKWMNCCTNLSIKPVDRNLILLSSPSFFLTLFHIAAKKQTVRPLKLHREPWTCKNGGSVIQLTIIGYHMLGIKLNSYLNVSNNFHSTYNLTKNNVFFIEPV